MQLNRTLNGLTLVLLAVAMPAAAEPPPNGLYFHAFTGAATGTEWSTWGPLNNPGRWEFADLTAGGAYSASITDTGAVTLDFGRGTGQMNSDGTGTLDFTLGGGVNFHSDLRRAPYTDDRFPVFASAFVAGDAALSGAWSARVLEVDPATGSTLHEFFDTASLEVAGAAIRITYSTGEFHQGAWVSADQAAFRVIEPNPAHPRYRSFAGSATSLDMDMLADLRVVDADHLTFVLAAQSRTPFPGQHQLLTYAEFTRIPAPASICSLGAAAVVARRRR